MAEYHACAEARGLNPRGHPGTWSIGHVAGSFSDVLIKNTLLNGRVATVTDIVATWLIPDFFCSGRLFYIFLILFPLLSLFSTLFGLRFFLIIYCLSINRELCNIV
jgi:hypothetical protein